LHIHKRRKNSRRINNTRRSKHIEFHNDRKYCVINVFSTWYKTKKKKLRTSAKSVRYNGGVNIERNGERAWFKFTYDVREDDCAQVEVVGVGAAGGEDAREHEKQHSGVHIRVTILTWTRRRLELASDDAKTARVDHTWRRASLARLHEFRTPRTHFRRAAVCTCCVYVHLQNARNFANIQMPQKDSQDCPPPFWNFLPPSWNFLFLLRLIVLSLSLSFTLFAICYARGHVVKCNEKKRKRSAVCKGHFTLKTLISIVCPCLIFHKRGIMLKHKSDYGPAIPE